MIKSLILHLYKHLNKSKKAINSIVCKIFEINYKYFDQNYEQLDELDEINNIRDHKLKLDFSGIQKFSILYESKCFTAKYKHNPKFKSKTIEIKYEGFDDIFIICLKFFGMNTPVRMIKIYSTLSYLLNIQSRSTVDSTIMHIFRSLKLKKNLSIKSKIPTN